MNSYPKFAEIKGIKYEINTDFRVALECNEIANNSEIKDEERSLAIIYLLFGEQGLNDYENWNSLLRIAIKFLSCGKEIEDEYDNEEKEENMDYQQDWGYIRTSFFRTLFKIL